MIYLILIAVYALSVLFNWNYFRRAHSQEGIQCNLDADNMCVAMTLIPIFNSIVVIALLLNGPAVERKENNNKFFKVKK